MFSKNPFKNVNVSLIYNRINTNYFPYENNHFKNLIKMITENYLTYNQVFTLPLHVLHRAHTIRKIAIPHTFFNIKTFDFR